MSEENLTGPASEIEVGTNASTDERHLTASHVSGSEVVLRKSAMLIRRSRDFICGGNPDGPLGILGSASRDLEERSRRWRDATWYVVLADLVSMAGRVAGTGRCRTSLSIWDIDFAFDFVLVIVPHIAVHALKSVRLRRARDLRRQNPDATLSVSLLMPIWLVTPLCRNLWHSHSQTSPAASPPQWLAPNTVSLAEFSDSVSSKSGAGVGGRGRNLGRERGGGMREREVTDRRLTGSTRAGEVDDDSKFIDNDELPMKTREEVRTHVQICRRTT